MDVWVEGLDRGEADQRPAPMTSIAFSADGRSLVSGSIDKTVKLWDVQTGGVVETFYGHTGWVLSVSISLDCTRIASGSLDHTICLWDIQTGKCYYTIEQQSWVDHISFFSTDPPSLISISGGKVWQWDLNGHQILPTYNGTHIAFSPDYSQFALYNGELFTVQDSDSREIVAKFHVANTETKCCCFSPDGRLVAAAAGNTAYVWDITTPDLHCIGSFVGHIGDIYSLVFSSSFLITGSDDQSVNFWKIGTLSIDLVTANPQPTSPTLAEIKSISLQAKDGIVISSDLDGVVKTWDISTGICKASFQTPAGESELLGWRDVQLIDSRVISVWYNGYNDGKIHIWDTEKEQLLQALDVTEPNALRISGNGSKIISLGKNSIQA